MEALITPNEVFALSFVGEENMKADRIPDSVIIAAQEKFLRPQINTLLDKITKTEYTSFLQDYIKPPLAFYVRYLILPSLTIQLSNMGAFTPENDFSKAATDRQRDTLRQSALTIAESLMTATVTYINENIESFPDFTKTVEISKIKGGIIL